MEKYCNSLVTEKESVSSITKMSTKNIYVVDYHVYISYSCNSSSKIFNIYGRLLCELILL